MEEERLQDEETSFELPLFVRDIVTHVSSFDSAVCVFRETQQAAVR
jgi:hypothetical protein